MQKKHLLSALLRHDLASFITKSFSTINPSMPFIHNWHIDLIADYLSLVGQGEIKRLIINIPPRFLKSVCVSVAWPAWLLGHNPATRIIAASYAQTISTRHSADCRLLISSDWYKVLFPHMQISKSHNQKTKFLTTQNGFRLATSVGGSITGDGGDILIVDDPHNPIHIASSKLREKVINWFEQTFTTRLNNPEKGAIIIVMQRLHAEDLSGYLLTEQHEHWHHLNIPVIASAKLYYHFALSKSQSLCKVTTDGYKMEKGDVLQPTRLSQDKLFQLQHQIGNDNFQAQYLQAPPIKESGFLKKGLIRYYATLPTSVTMILQSWDTAITVSDNSDYSVCSTWLITNDHYYLIDLLHEKLMYPELKRAALEKITQFNPAQILIEDKSSGQSLIQDLKKDGVRGIVPQKVKLEKMIRFAAIIPLFEAGKILLPEDASWLKTCVDQLTLFPHSRHDDIVDSVSQAVNFLQHSIKLREPVIRSF